MIMNLSYNFSLDTDTDIEFVEPFSEHSQTDCENDLLSFKNELLLNDELPSGERIEGFVDGDLVTLKICVKVGEDWNDDEYENYTYNKITKEVKEVTEE